MTTPNLPITLKPIPFRNSKLVSLILTPVGTYNDQYLRSYTTQLTGDLLAKIKEVTAFNIDTSDLNSHVSNVTPASLVVINEPIVDYLSFPGSKVEIPNGFQTPRYVFVMKIEITSIIGFITTETISGYTDSMGKTSKGSIDDDMFFIINSIFTTRDYFITTPSGTLPFSKIINNTNVLLNNTNSKQRLLRPQDIFGGIESKIMSERNQESIFDYRSHLQTKPVLSNRSNNIPSVFISNIINAYRDSVRGQDDNEFELNMDAVNSAKVFVSESNLGTTIFGHDDGKHSGLPAKFLFKDLVKMFPDAGSLVVVVDSFLGVPYQVSNANDSSVWSTSDLTTKTAAVIASVVKTIMSELGIVLVEFGASNKFNFSDENPALITGVEFLFEHDNVTQTLDIFMNRIENELLKLISYNNQVSYEISVIANLFTDTVIDISLDNKTSTRFVAPMFCDSLFVPVITDKALNKDSLIADIETILFNI